MDELQPFMTVDGFIAGVWVPSLVVGTLLPAFGSLIAAGIRAALRAMGLSDADS